MICSGCFREIAMPEQHEPGTPTRLLLIDDDVELCELVTEYLQPEGFDVDVVHDGRQGMEQAVGGKYALVILDVMMPGLSGFDVLRSIRGRSPIPVLMLTARGDDVDRIVGLEIGADDYLPKPFNPRELIARIRAVLRRARQSPDSPADAARGRKLAVEDIELEPGARVVRRNGATVELTAVEFSLLEILLRSAGTVISRHDLSRALLGRRFMPYDRSIDMHVSNLRRKLGHMVADRERIKSIRGYGYVYTVAGQPVDAGDRQNW
jgi:two-component system response regulator CpxR